MRVVFCLYLNPTSVLFIVLQQHLQAALVTTVMGPHHTMIMRNSPTLDLRTRPSGKPLSEKWVLMLEIESLCFLWIKKQNISVQSKVWLMAAFAFLNRSLWSSPCNFWSLSPSLPSSPLWMTPSSSCYVIHGHIMCPMLSSLWLWSSSAAVETSAANTPGTLLPW